MRPHRSSAMPPHQKSGVLGPEPTLLAALFCSPAELVNACRMGRWGRGVDATLRRPIDEFGTKHLVNVKHSML